MRGLICRDLLICYRRTSKSNYVTDILFFLFFLLVLRNRYSCITYLLCVMPLNMSGMPMILKEMDVNQKGLWIASLYPVSSKNLVLSRYVAVFIQQLHYVAMMLLYILLHAMLYQDYSIGGYLQMFFLAWIMGILFASLNLITCFTASLNVAATLYAGMVVLVVIAYLLCSILFDIDFTFLFQMNTVFLLGGAGLAVALIVAVTYLVSLHFFLRQRAKI